MSSEMISREELKAMLDVQAKSTEQMTLVAQRLQVIAELQAKMNDALKNGISDAIIEKVNEHHNLIFERVKEMMQPNFDIIKQIRDDSFWVKIIVGSSALVIAIVQIVMQAIEHTHSLIK